MKCIHRVATLTLTSLVSIACARAGEVQVAAGIALNEAYGKRPSLGVSGTYGFYEIFDVGLDLATVFGDRVESVGLGAFLRVRAVDNDYWRLYVFGGPSLTNTQEQGTQFGWLGGLGADAKIFGNQAVGIQGRLDLVGGSSDYDGDSFSRVGGALTWSLFF